MHTYMYKVVVVGTLQMTEHNSTQYREHVLSQLHVCDQVLYIFKLKFRKITGMSLPYNSIVKLKEQWFVLH